MTDEEDSGTSLKIAGFNLSGWAMAAAIPVLSSISGAVYFGYDALSRFNAVEEAVEPLLNLESRMQSVEQTISANDVATLSSKLTKLATTMETILEQQKVLLDLRSKVERSDTITARLEGSLSKYDQEVEDLWKAVDELNKSPLGR